MDKISEKISEKYRNFNELNPSHKWKYESCSNNVCTTCGVEILILSDLTTWYKYRNTWYRVEHVPTCSTVQMRKALE